MSTTRLLLALGLALPTLATADDCRPHVVLTGYWPPTNEMLRPWSASAAQNPGGWQGANWGGYGFDVFAFFPEFPPDGDPTNDAIGDAGSVGDLNTDLPVDYQETSADFWRIVDEHEPVILITTSRGGSIGWELEAVEGGHDGGADPALDWASDRHGAVTHPRRESIDARSWAAISTYRAGRRLESRLPLDAIAEATAALDLVSVEIEGSTSGNYLSGFMGLHGLYYNRISSGNVAAGHIHVGRHVSAADARALMEASLHAVLGRHRGMAGDCP